jgi:hypothetical protein
MTEEEQIQNLFAGISEAYCPNWLIYTALIMIPVFIVGAITLGILIS